MALHLASLYDISLTRNELQVAFVLIYAIARTALTIKTKFPVTTEKTYKNALKAVAKFFLALRKKGTKAQRNKEIGQALNEVTKALGQRRMRERFQSNCGDVRHCRLGRDRVDIELGILAGRGRGK